MFNRKDRKEGVFALLCVLGGQEVGTTSVSLDPLMGVAHVN
jgi:hypothetical protein